MLTSLRVPSPDNVEGPGEQPDTAIVCADPPLARSKVAEMGWLTVAAGTA